MNTQKGQVVRQKLETALAGVMSELSGIAAGKSSVSTQKELEFIAAKLQDMLESVNQGRKIETVGLWHIVVDTWPHTNRLRRQIVEAELDYERLK